MYRFLVSTLFSTLLFGACSTPEAAKADSSAVAVGPVAYAYERVPLDTSRPLGGVIDSIFPMPEMIRRFRVGLPAVDTLITAATSRDALAASFVQALATRDQRKLGQLTLSRAEFASVYVPNAPEINRVNGLPPQRILTNVPSKRRHGNCMQKQWRVTRERWLCS
jgi:hypothetical protein